MSDPTYIQPSEPADTTTLGLRITEELNEKINMATAASKLSKSAMLRLAIDRGIDRLLDQLETGGSDQ
jgi:hypothetical protein